MFGYITPVKPVLRICDFELYKAAYCGVCFELQKNFGYFSKSFLNYDFVFVALLGRSVCGEAPKICKKRCNTNPLKKCSVQSSVEIDRYSAAALITSAYFKLLDNVTDERFFKRLASRLALPFAKRGYKKAKKLYPQLVEEISRGYYNQLEAEKQPFKGLDSAADSTSLALSDIFGDLTQNEGDSRVLKRLGYLIGRFVYIADSADDLLDDVKYKRYNPLHLEFSQNGEGWETAAIEFAKSELNATASEIANAYNLLELKHYTEILNNIIFLGLKRTIALLGKEKGNNKDEQSL